MRISLVHHRRKVVNYNGELLNFTARTDFWKILCVFLLRNEDRTSHRTKMSANFISPPCLLLLDGWRRKTMCIHFVYLSYFETTFNMWKLALVTTSSLRMKQNADIGTEARQKSESSFAAVFWLSCAKFSRRGKLEVPRSCSLIFAYAPVWTDSIVWRYGSKR